MRHDDTGIVVVLDVIEELAAVSGREVFFACIQNLIIRECGLVGHRYLGDIGLQCDNHRLVGQSQTVHLVCGHAHDEGLAGSHFVVTDTATILE